jgi:hypothetical protein
MEGTAEAVKGWRTGLLLCAAIAATTAAAVPQPRSDVLVAERTDRLLLYNRYQQHLSAHERARLLPCTPFRIVNEHDVLGDGFTPCIDLEFQGAAYYLVGATEEARQEGFFRIYRNVVLLSDTVEVLRDRAVSLTPVARGASVPPLRAGERIVRMFREGEETLVLRTGQHPSYVWVRLRGGREGKDWRGVTRAVPASTTLPDETVERIRGRVKKTNALLQRLFTFFNRETNGRRPAPFWSVEGTDTRLECVLRGADGDRFAESTRYLARDLENILLGTGFSASPMPGRIVIRRVGEDGRGS